MSEVKNKIQIFKEFEIILNNFDINSKKIPTLLKQGYSNEAIILTVVIFEVLLKDLFKASRGAWIQFGQGHDIWKHELDSSKQEQNKIEARKIVIKYLESLGAYNNFLKNYYLYHDDYPYPETEILYNTLFVPSSKINFQNISDEKGARHAYKIFLNIDLRNILDSDKEMSKDKWKKLNELIKQRHKIVHTGSSTTMSPTDIIDVLSALSFMKDSITKTIFSYHGFDKESFKLAIAEKTNKRNLE